MQSILHARSHTKRMSLEGVPDNYSLLKCTAIYLKDKEKLVILCVQLSSCSFISYDQRKKCAQCSTNNFSTFRKIVFLQGD